MRKRVLSLALLTGLLMSGCSPKPELENRPSEFPFAAEGSEVSGETIQAEPGARPITGDFNRDGLEDIAVVEATGESTSEIVIYIRKKGTDTETPVFYRGGVITSHATGRIVGVLKDQRGNMVDLIVLVAGEDGQNEMLTLYNTGSSFSEDLIGVDAGDLNPTP